MADIVVESGFRDRIEDLVGRRREVRLVAALVAIAGVVSLVLWMRGAPATIAPPATSNGGLAPVTPEASTETIVVVHVGGAVRKPGIYELQPGARVADAVDLAGLRSVANVNALNLAEPLVDGSKVDVPRRGETAVPAPGLAPPTSPSTGAPGAGTPVDINTADQTVLETLPEVGPVTAQAIIEYRTQIGSFTSIEQLLEVSGIGPATFEAMRSLVTV
ncbi:MAG: helix-hairpin-helix domain-containing protein [Actinomycetota bacterium]